MTTAIKVGIAALVLLVGGAGARCHARAEGRWLEREAQLVAENDSLAAVSARVDTIRLRDSVAFWNTRWDTLRVTDTVTVENVVYVRRDSADSTITRCTRALGSCEASRAAILAEMESWKALAELRADDPRRRRWYDRIGVNGGYGVQASPGGTFSHGIQLTAGVKLWPP